MPTRRARLMGPGSLGLTAALLAALVAQVGAECERTCRHDLVACVRTTCAGQRGPERGRCVAECRGRTGCRGGFGTIAYVVAFCRVLGAGEITAAQELRIRREGCDPVTMVRLTTPAPIPDPIGLCALLSRNHSGVSSPIAGVFQRLGVTPTGSGVVFEISNQFELVGQTPLAPEQQGFFYVRTDGTGLRRLGPPSLDPTWRLFANTRGPLPSPDVRAGIAFSPNGRRFAYSDLGPAPDGVETEQIFPVRDGSGRADKATNTRSGHLPRART